MRFVRSAIPFNRPTEIVFVPGSNGKLRFNVFGKSLANRRTDSDGATWL